MVTLTADRALEELLVNVKQSAEIRDRQGNLLGYFTPAEQALAEMYKRAAAHFDPEEMRRRAESPEKGVTTQEVLDHLRSLESE